MRVAFINDQPAYSGMGRYAFYLYETIREIQNRGSPNDQFEFDHLFLNYQNRSLERLTTHNPQFITRTGKIPFLDNKPWFWKRMQNRLPEYDVYHIVNQNISILAKGRRSVVTCHDISPLFYPENWIDLWGRRVLYRGMHSATRIIAISEYTRQTLIEHLHIPADRIEVIYHGVPDGCEPRPKEEVRRQLNLPLDKKIILHIGSDDKRKNVKRLIEAFSLLQEKLPSTILIRLGKERRENINWVRKKGLSQKVWFIPMVEEGMVPLYYNAADLLVLPSLYEGFGLPLIEAMASGCPIVASNKSSIPEVVGDAALLVDPLNREEITEGMCKILTDDDYARILVYKGLERAKFFTWEKSAKKTLEIYKKL